MVSGTPVGTLRDQVGRHWLWLNCRCGRAAKFDPADLADAYGIDTPLAEVIERARCGHCGQRGGSLTIQPPTHIDGSDRPRDDGRKVSDIGG